MVDSCLILLRMSEERSKWGVGVGGLIGGLFHLLFFCFLHLFPNISPLLPSLSLLSLPSGRGGKKKGGDVCVEIGFEKEKERGRRAKLALSNPNQRRPFISLPEKFLFF